MRTASPSRHTGAELAGWAVRGLLVAAPSMAWAVLGGFNRLADWTAMLVGTAVWIGAVGWFSVAARSRAAEFVQLLKMSAWLKAASVPLGLAALSVLGHLRLPGIPWLVATLMPDLWCGFGSVRVVERMTGVPGEMTLATQHVFGWTLMTTLLQGAFVILLIAAGAFALLGWRRLGRALRAASFLSAGSAG